MIIADGWFSTRFDDTHWINKIEEPLKLSCGKEDLPGFYIYDKIRHINVITSFEISCLINVKVLVKSTFDYPSFLNKIYTIFVKIFEFHL
jgi:hypothetical protein